MCYDIYHHLHACLYLCKRVTQRVRRVCGHNECGMTTISKLHSQACSKAGFANTTLAPEHVILAGSSFDHFLEACCVCLHWICHCCHCCNNSKARQSNPRQTDRNFSLTTKIPQFAAKSLCSGSSAASSSSSKLIECRCKDGLAIDDLHNCKILCN